MNNKETNKKTILALTAEPNDSETMIRYAASMANDLGTKLHLLNVVEMQNHAVVTPGMAGAIVAQEHYEQRAKENLSILEKQGEQVASQLKTNLEITCSTEVGDSRSILETYMKDHTKSIVLLESGKHNNFWLQGTTNMGIIRNIPYPVWVVPHRAEYMPVKNIVYASDFKEEDIGTLKKLISLFYRNQPEITALHITDSEDFKEKMEKEGFQEMIRKKTEYKKIRVKLLSESNGTDLGNMVYNYAIFAEADLITVLKEDKPFLERIFKSSSTKKIIEEVEQLPVMVYHENK